MINKYLFNFLIELALFVQIVLWACIGVTIIVPLLIWYISCGECRYFNIEFYLTKFRNYKIKE